MGGGGSSRKGWRRVIVVSGCCPFAVFGGASLPVVSSQEGRRASKGAETEGRFQGVGDGSCVKEGAGSSRKVGSVRRVWLEECKLCCVAAVAPSFEEGPRLRLFVSVRARCLQRRTCDPEIVKTELLLSLSPLSLSLFLPTLSLSFRALSPLPCTLCPWPIFTCPAPSPVPTDPSKTPGGH